MKKLLAFALVGVAGAAIGCERLFGVDFGDTPSRGDAGAALEDADVDEDAGDGATPPDAAKDATVDAGRCTARCEAEPWTTDPAVALAVDATNVYIAEPQSLAARLVRCAKADACKTPAFVVATPDPVKLVELDGMLYWSTGTAVKSILATANNGTSKELYADTTVGINTFAVGGGYLYPRRGDKIMRCPLNAASCTPTDVIPGQGGAPSLVVTDTSIVWGATLDSMVHQCNPASCTATKTTLGGPYENTSVISAKGDITVWPSSTPTAGVYICATKGCTTPQLLAASPKPIMPVTDGTDVYWGDLEKKAILRCPIGGGCGTGIVHVAEQTLRPKDQIVVDDAGVYWTTSAGIRRARK